MIQYTLKAYLFIIAFFFIQDLHAAVKRWNGSSSKNWNDVLNWTPTGLPLESDDVLLDNMLVTGDYSVLLPTVAVTIISIEILPSGGRKIDLAIPPLNLAAPALNLSSSGYALVLNEGATFKNSSGLTSGQSLSIAGKIVIGNGARYIHNTRASHATGIIAKLSTDAGTEKGVFEFDVPGGAYAISLSNRNYGSLKLSGIASDGTQTYNATGSSVTNIRGDLEIAKGVGFNLDLEKTLTIAGDFLQSGGVFNLAYQPNHLQVIFKGSFIQDSSAVITETSTGTPEISFEGTSTQLVSLHGVTLNSVGFNINNPYGIFLNANFIIPYSLHFKLGNIRSFPTAMVKVADNAIVTNASPLSFVDGPVMKTGDEDFEFPIGSQGDYAPLKLSGNARSTTDQCVAEYHHGNPQQSFGSNIEISSILRISSLEYWSLDRAVPRAQEKVSLSVGPYSHATSLEKLVITQWDRDGLTWKNLGNTAYAGISSGTITSELANIRGVFTIGTTVADQNPLPAYFERLTGEWSGENLKLKWKAYNQSILDQYRIDFSDDGLTFGWEHNFDAYSLTGKYLFTKDFPGKTKIYARVILLIGGVEEVQSQTILVSRSKPRLHIRVYPTLAREMIHLNMTGEKQETIDLQVLDQNGKIVQSVKRQSKEGVNDFQLSVSNLSTGIYFARVSSSTGPIETIKFIKL